MDNRKPDFVIIGAQKSASTFIHNWISEHPDAFMLHGEIPIFESPDYENSSMELFYKSFSNCNEKIVGFKRPNYLGRSEVPERIYNNLPDAKLIAVLRNPIDRAISACYHNINYGFLPVENPDVLLNKIFKGEDIVGYPRANEIIEFGLYHKYLEMYQNYYESGKLLIVNHDDIKKDSRNEVKKIYSYLGIDSNFVAKSLKSRPQSVIYNLNRLRFLRLRNRIIYRYNSSRTRLTKRRGFILKIVRGLFDKFDSLVLSKIFKNEKDQISNDTLVLIQNAYKNDIQNLEKKYGLNLDTWKQNGDLGNVDK